MDSLQVAQIARQVNAIGKEHDIFCVYTLEKGKFIWIFYRRTAAYNVRLGKTSKTEKVIKKMEAFACTR